MKPHAPFNVDKNCNSINTKGKYEYNYKCTLYLIKKFVKNINLLSEKQKIIIFSGDHGYALSKNDQLIIKDDDNPAIHPTHDLFGLILGNIFFVPHLRPKTYAAESHIHIDIIIQIVKYV